MSYTLCLATKRGAILLSCLFLAELFLSTETTWAQTRLIAIESSNKPLPSLANAAEAARAVTPLFSGGLLHVPLGSTRTQVGGFQGPDDVLQDFNGPNLAHIVSGFEGSDNEDNLAVLDFRVAPPDTNGDVGYHNESFRYVQMLNLITTVFDQNGDVVPGGGPFPNNIFWSGSGGNCEAFNQGDPVVLYDETNGRWLVSQFAFDELFTTFSHCIAVSQSSDPLGAYNRYEFSFDDPSLGLPDYPKHGIVTDSVTMTANLFAPPLFFFSGSFLAAIDKDPMYDGFPTTMLYATFGCPLFSSSCEVGFLPADLDDAAGSAGSVQALFATAMSRPRRFDIWQLDVDWTLPDPLSAASIGRVADPRIAASDADLCPATREACIPQPNGGPALEAISDRLMHRLQIRDFGSHKSMMAAHTVDADGNGTAGIRWYEMRQNPKNGRWSKHQEGTYAPADGLHRWMPSIAMNATGDIGMGFLVSSETEPMGIRTTGQTAASSGSGTFDGSEDICLSGVTEQIGTARSGDYGSTSVDPVTDNFWHTNQYGQRNDKSAGWGTYVCEFEITAGGGSCTPTEEPEMSCSDDLDNDCDGLIDVDDSDCSVGGPCLLALLGESCSNNGDCCSGSCSKGRPSLRVCLP